MKKLDTLMGRMNMKKIIKTAGQVIVNILAGITVVALLVLKGIAKYANVLTLAGVIAILVMLCRG